jgi:MYXO-CTERM domain-containing protein
VDALLRRLARTAFRRATGGEHWAWWVIALCAFVLRRARRRPELVTTLDLGKGDRYEVRLLRAEEAAPAAVDA